MNLLATTSQSLTGILWGLGTAIGFTFYQIANRRLVYQASVNRTTFLSLLGSVAVGVIIVSLLENRDAWAQVTTLAGIWFLLSGVFHFSIGWTLLGLAQRAIGAARAAPLTTTSIFLGAVLGAIVFDEPFNMTLVLGMIMTVVGVYLISHTGGQTPFAGAKLWQGIVLAILAGCCWAVSPVLFRFGYAQTPSVLIAVLVSLVAGALVSGLFWAFETTRPRKRLSASEEGFLPVRQFWLLQASAAVIVGLAVFGRWISLVYLPISAVNALNMLPVPSVVILAPLILGQKLESTGWRLIVGMLSAMAGVAVVVAGGVVSGG